MTNLLQNERRRAVIVVGSTFSGCTSLSKLVQQTFEDHYVVCPGRLFFDWRKKTDERWDRVREYVRKAKPVPDEIMREVVLPQVSEIRQTTKRTLVLNKLPLTMPQFEMVRQELQNLSIAKDDILTFFRDATLEDCLKNMESGKLRERHQHMTEEMVRARHSSWVDVSADIRHALCKISRVIDVEQYQDPVLAVDFVREHLDEFARK